MPKKIKRREDYQRLKVGNRRQTVYISIAVYIAAGRKGRLDPRCPDRLREV